MSILIDSVTPHTPAAKAGIRAGDRLVAVNGNLIHDVLDYRFYMIDTVLTVEVERDSKPLTFHIKKEEYDELGLEFTDYLMDRQHHCANKCVFCFVDQLPKGMRETLYFKDDDSRMSFLFGSYVTLTNMTDEDIARIIKMHISPINISVHATNPELRVELMKNPRSGEVLKYIPQLAAHHIRINAQIVVCPGLNDGEELRRSLWDLGQYAPEVQSIALVPVGLTGHREGLYPLRMMKPEEAADCIRIADEFGEEMLRRHGSRIAFCADELYLIAGLPLPDYSYYEDFDQLGNGVGTTALLRDEFASALSMEDGDEEKSHFSLATGEAAAPLLRELLETAKDKFPHRQLTVYGVPNITFGGGVNVTGLVCGRDIIEYLRDKPLYQGLILPEIMLRDEKDKFLDDTTPYDVAEALQTTVHVAGMDGADLLDALLGLTPPLA